MRVKPTYWDEITSLGDCIYEPAVKLVFTNGARKQEVWFYKQSLSDGGIKVDHGVSPFSVGNALSAHVTFTVVGDGVNYSLFQAGMVVEVHIRAYSRTGYRPSGGSTVKSTDYLKYGTYYIDSSSLDESGGVAVSAYDVIKQLERPVVDAVPSATTINKSNISSFTGGLIPSDASFLTDSRFNSNPMLQKDTVIDAKPSQRDLIGVFVGYAGDNLILRESGFELLGTYKSPYGGYHPVDNLQYDDKYTNEPHGVVATCESFRKDDIARIFDVAILKDGEIIQGRSSTTYYDALNGAFFTVEMPSWAETNDYAYSIGHMLSGVCGVKPYALRNVTVRGAVLSPLYEIGDSLCVKTMDGTYYTFFPTNMSITLGALCYGDLEFDASHDLLYERYSSSGLTTVSFPQQTPQVTVLGEYVLRLDTIDTGVALGADTVRYGMIRLSAVNIDFTITYTDNNDVQHTVTTKSRIPIYSDIPVYQEVSQQSSGRYFMAHDVEFIVPKIFDASTVKSVDSATCELLYGTSGKTFTMKIG